MVRKFKKEDGSIDSGMGCVVGMTNVNAVGSENV